MIIFKIFNWYHKEILLFAHVAKFIVNPCTIFCRANPLWIHSVFVLQLCIMKFFGDENYFEGSFGLGNAITFASLRAKCYPGWAEERQTLCRYPKEIFQVQREGSDLGVAFGIAHAFTDSLSHSYPGRFARGYYFRNTLFEVALQAEVYLLKALLNIRPYIYAIAGFLVLFYEPHLNDAKGVMQPSRLVSL